jgi:hypothetical protein
MKRNTNWAAKQVEQANEDLKSWPKWMLETTQYRNAKDGQFKTEKQAERMKPENVVKERVPNPGYGDTGRGKKK